MCDIHPMDQDHQHSRRKTSEEGHLVLNYQRRNAARKETKGYQKIYGETQLHLPHCLD